jgi:hypothetical protein
MEKLMKTGQCWIKVESPLEEPKISYDQGETWENLDTSDIKTREFSTVHLVEVMQNRVYKN